MRDFLSRWNLLAANRRARQAFRGQLADQHTLTLPKGNLYVEHDIGTKNMRYPDGSMRPVASRKVYDTAGTTFYTFDTSIRLS